MKKLFFTLSFFFAISISFSSCTKDEDTLKQNTETQKAHPGSIALLDGCDGGEDEDPLPMLSGMVSNTSSNPLARACVELRTSTHQFVAIIGTDSSGHYYFNNVSNGNYYLVVSKSGYTPQNVNVTVSGTAQIVNVVLQ